MFKLLRLFVSSLSFLQIVFGPTFVAGLIAFFIYNSKPDRTGLIESIVVLALGLIAGLILAIRITKKQDPADYVSQTGASPDKNDDNPDFFHPL